MKIGVVQHRLRSTSAEDVHAMAGAVRSAVDLGARFVAIPCIVGLAGDAVRDGVIAELRATDAERALFAPACYSAGQWGIVDSLACLDDVGEAAAFCGDGCFDTDAWRTVAEVGAAMAVLSPAAESDLQAEAAVEVAIALSDAMCGLVLVAECAGAEPGMPGHAGSAIIHLGDVLAEASGDDDEVLIADVRIPVPQPEPRAPLPELPTILTQRVSLHGGHKPDVPYLADLSGGLKTSG